MGENDGADDGRHEGGIVGAVEGIEVGIRVGMFDVGFDVGYPDGDIDGVSVGASDVAKIAPPRTAKRPEQEEVVPEHPSASVYSWHPLPLGGVYDILEQTPHVPPPSSLNATDSD